MVREILKHGPTFPKYVRVLLHWVASNRQIKLGLIGSSQIHLNWKFLNFQWRPRVSKIERHIYKKDDFSAWYFP